MVVGEESEFEINAASSEVGQFEISSIMDSVIELQRQTHEEIERFEGALYDLLSRPTTAHERKLQNEHKASQVLDRITTRTTALNNLYVDGDSRKEEINRLTASSKADDLSEFYSRLVKIQEHHNKYPDSAPGIDLELASFLEELGQEEEDLDVEDDRTFPLSTLSSFTEKRSQQFPSCSRERKHMANTVICTLVTLHIQTSKVLASGQATSSIWIFC